MLESEFQLEEERRCPRCDGDDLQYAYGKGITLATCNTCKGTGRVVVITELGQQILDFIDKYRPNGGAA